MRKLSRREKTLLLLLGLFLFFLLGQKFILEGGITYYLELKAKLEEARSAVAAKQAAATDLDQLRQDYTVLENKLTRKKRGFYASGDTNTPLRLISEHLGELNVVSVVPQNLAEQVEQVEQAEKKEKALEKESVCPFYVHLTLEGFFPEVVQFISDMENLPQLTLVEQVGIEVCAVQSKEDWIKAEILMAFLGIPDGTTFDLYLDYNPKKWSDPVFDYPGQDQEEQALKESKIEIEEDKSVVKILTKYEFPVK